MGKLRRQAVLIQYLQILNDYQTVCDEEAPEWAEQGPEGKRLYYDHPSYDVLWKTLVELDRPFYLHPRLHTGPFYKKRPWVDTFSSICGAY